MIGSVFFIFNRLVEIVFLIPIIGMLVCPLLTSPISNTPPSLPLMMSLNIGLLRERLSESKPADPTIYPGPLHRQRNRRLLGHRHANPLLNNKAIRNLRRVHGPALRRRLYCSRLRAPFYHQRQLCQLAWRLRLDLSGSIRLLWPEHK